MELFLRARKSLIAACLDEKGKPKSELNDTNLSSINADLEFLNAVRAETETETALTMELLAFAYAQNKPSDVERSYGWIKKLTEWLNSPQHLASQVFMCKLHKEQPLLRLSIVPVSQSQATPLATAVAAANGAANGVVPVSAEAAANQWQAWSTEVKLLLPLLEKDPNTILPKWYSRIHTLRYLNLDYRPDRRKMIETELFERLGLSREPQDGMPRVTRAPGIVETLGTLGCSKRHARCLEEFILEVSDPEALLALVEDDAKFADDISWVHRSLDIGVCGLKFNVLMGSTLLGKTEPINETNSQLLEMPNEKKGIVQDLVEKVIDTSDARFYIITRAYAPVLLKNLLEGIELLTKSPNEHHLYANDQYWKRLQADGWYRFKTRLEVQRLAEAGSDAGIMNVQAMIAKGINVLSADSSTSAGQPSLPPTPAKPNTVETPGSLLTSAAAALQKQADALKWVLVVVERWDVHTKAQWKVFKAQFHDLAWLVIVDDFNQYMSLKTEFPASERTLHHILHISQAELKSMNALHQSHGYTLETAICYWWNYLRTLFAEDNREGDEEKPVWVVYPSAIRARHNQWREIFEDLNTLHPETDLLACNLAHFKQCHSWYWWWNGLELHKSTKKADKLGLPMAKQTYSRDAIAHRSFAGLYRMSPRFVNKLDSNLGEVTAYGELYLPTLCAILKSRDGTEMSDLTGLRKGVAQKPWTLECINPPFVSADPMYVERKIGLDQVVRDANPFPVDKGRLVVVSLAKEWTDLQREQLEAYLAEPLKRPLAAAAAVAAPIATTVLVSKDEKYDVKGFTLKSLATPVASASAPAANSGAAAAAGATAVKEIEIPVPLEEPFGAPPTFYKAEFATRWLFDKWLGNKKTVSENRMVTLDINPKRDESTVYLRRRIGKNGDVLMNNYRLHDFSVNLLEWKTKNEVEQMDVVRFVHGTGPEYVAALKSLVQWKPMPDIVVLQALPPLNDAERQELTAVAVPYRHAYRVQHNTQTLKPVSMLCEISGDWLLSTKPIQDLIHLEKAKQEK